MLKFQLSETDKKSGSNGTQLSKYDLQDMTRRNANPRADMKQLYEEFGGVLISRYDLGSLLDEQVDTYLLDLEFTVGIEAEPNTEYSLVPAADKNLMVLTDLANGNTALVDAAIAAADARYNARILLPTQTTVLFLYENGSRLEGDSLKMEFVKTIF